MANITYTNSSTTGSGAMMRLEQVCIQFPPKVSSPGLATLNKTDDLLLLYSGPRLHLQMLVTFLLTQLIHNLFFKFHALPIFVSQILAGIILGPSVFSNQNSLIMISNESVRILGTLASFGYLSFLFLSGVKIDLSLVCKAGRKAICIGVLTVLVPMATCLITDHILTGETNFVQNKNFILSIIYSGTSFPVVHGLLTHLKILNSELGRIGLSAALVSDVVSLVLMFIGHWVNHSDEGAKSVLGNMGLNVAFVAIVFFVLRPAMKWMVRRTPEGGKIKDSFVYAVILLFLLTPRISDAFGVFILFAPFILGLAVPDGPPLGSALVEKMDPMVSGLFLPLFASTCGMRLDLSQLPKSNQYAKNQAFAAIATLYMKFLVSVGLPLAFNMPKKDSLALAFILISKGIVEMASCSTLLDNGIISEDIFAIMSVITIVLATIVPLLVKIFYDPSGKYISYEQRSIFNSKDNEKLRMMGCIYVPGNVNSIINLLYSSCPTEERPIELDVLHLVKLSGRATPLFIAYQKNSKTHSDYNSYSENVVLAFSQFERDLWGVISVKIFTAVSPQNLMYKDICNLARDKLTSFIILPFHRRWSIDGSIESEDQAIRSLNSKVLDSAPCSVGILVDCQRGVKRSNNYSVYSSSTSSNDDSSIRIAVVFLGGADDREAMALAKRISLDPMVRLTVIHFIFNGCTRGANESDNKMLDNEMLTIMRETADVKFMLLQVDDCSGTSSFLRETLNEYQLIIVGRRYKMKDPRTSGLEEWSEFPEIGILGDLLASPDCGGSCSVLIVQQQPVEIA